MTAPAAPREEQPESLPTWLREVDVALPSYPHIVLTGDTCPWVISKPGRHCATS